MNKNREEQKKIRGNILRNAAVLPALLLCTVMLTMLILDAAIPEMSEAQYVVFPLLIRITSAVSLICALSTFIPGIGIGMPDLDAGRVLFLLFLLCIMISTVINGFERGALLGVQFRYIGVFDMVTLIIAYMMCSSSISDHNIRKAVLISYLIVADLIAVVFLIDLNTGIIKAFKNKNEPSAIFFHGNHYGYFLVIAFVISAGLYLCSSGILRCFAAFSLGLNLLALAMNRSMGCILAVTAVFVVAIICFLVKGTVPRRLVLLSVVLIALLAFIVLMWSSALREDILELLKESFMLVSGEGAGYIGHGRIALWNYTAELIKERPLAGYGCEGISEMLGDRFWYSDNPHNEVLTYAAYYGIPAAFIYTAAVITRIIKGLRSGDSISMIAATAATAYFISSMFGVAMFYTIPFFFVLLGLTDRKLVDERY